jgi:hypothetical protein
MSNSNNVNSKLISLLFFRLNQYFMQMTDPPNDRFEPNSVFWGTWGGRIVRAIVLLDAYSKDAILKATSLKAEEFDQAIKGLLEDTLVEVNESNKIWVVKELYIKCRKYFEISQESLVNWVEEWRKEKGIEPTFENNVDHFYLSGRLLPSFSESLIQKAADEIIVANPFVRRCHICDSLKTMSEKGVNVRILTRGIESSQFKRELTKGIMISYDESVHAKIIIADGRVGIISSMNLYAGSTAGQSWEAGIVTTDRSAVSSIKNSVLGKIKEQKMLLDMC